MSAVLIKRRFLPCSVNRSYIRVLANKNASNEYALPLGAVPEKCRNFDYFQGPVSKTSSQGTEISHSFVVEKRV